MHTKNSVVGRRISVLTNALSAKLFARNICSIYIMLAFLRGQPSLKGRVKISIDRGSLWIFASLIVIYFYPPLHFLTFYTEILCGSTFVYTISHAANCLLLASTSTKPSLSLFLPRSPSTFSLSPSSILIRVTLIAIRTMGSLPAHLKPAELAFPWYLFAGSDRQTDRRSG